VRRRRRRKKGCILWDPGKSRGFQTARESAVYLHCRESSHALLTLDLVYHQTKTLRTLRTRAHTRTRIHICARARGERSRVVPPSQPTFPRELPSSRMLVTLALGDSRLVYAVICSTMDDLNSSGASMDESPGIPAGRKQALSLFLSFPLSLSSSL